MTYYKRIWLAVYILANLIGAMIFGMSGQLDGDLIGYPLPGNSVLLVATIAVVASYLIWMGPIFSYMASIKIKTIFSRKESAGVARDSSIVGIVVLIVQICFLIFNSQEGVNVAGSRLQSDSSIRYFWILLAPDALFLVYYGIYRKSALFGPNLILYLISNAMRGWLGTWLTIFFIEGAHRLREGRLNWKILILLIVIFIPFLPVLIELKWVIRELGTGGVLSLDEVSSRLMESIIDMDWWAAFSDSMRPIVMRFQHLANVIGIIDVSTDLSRGLTNGEFKNIFEEGLPQYTVEKIFGISVLPDIHVALLTYLIPEQLPVDTITNTHVGLVGWFWISPSLVPFYLLYLLVLSWLGMWLAKKAGGEGLLIDIIWFSWLGYLMNGWFAAYIEFMQALVVLVCIRALASRVVSSRHVDATSVYVK